MSIEAPTRPSSIKTGEFYRISVRGEINLSPETSILPPQARKAAELILHTFEGKSPVEAGSNSALPEQKIDMRDSSKQAKKIYQPVKVYQNGDNAAYPTQQPGERWFRVERASDGITRTSEFAGEAQKAPAYIKGENGQPDIFVSPDSSKGNKGKYLVLGENGRPIIENGQPKKIVPDDPSKIVPSRFIDPITRTEVAKFTEGELTREEIKQNINELIAIRCADLIQKTAEDPKSKEVIEGWKDVEEVTTAVMAIINSKSVNSIQRKHALNAVDAGLQAATNPDYKIAFVAGFGASDAPFTTNRYPVNAVPTLEMAARFQEYSEERKKQGKRGLQKPVVELIFAQEAGIQANYQDNADYVRAQMDRNIGNVRTFTDEFYPELDVRFVKDRPWNDHDPVTKAMIAYSAHQIRNHQSPHMEKTIKKAVEFGHGKGGSESSEETAINYAAIHAMVWGDALHIAPYNYTADPRPQTHTRVRIGSHSEKAFDPMVMAVIENGSHEDFKSFAANLPEPITSISDISSHQPTMIYGITDKGEHGTSYFRKPFDKEFGTPYEEEIVELKRRAGLVKERMSLRGKDLKELHGPWLMKKEEHNFEVWAAALANFNSSINDLETLSEVRVRRQAILAAV